MKIKIANLFGYDIDDIEVVLGDDSYPNLTTLQDKAGILYRELSKDEMMQGNYPDSYEGYLRQTSWDKNEITNIFGNIYENTSRKVLRK